MRLQHPTFFKAIIAIPAAAALLVACGSKDEEAKQTTSSVTTTKTSTSTASAVSSSEQPSSEAPTSEPEDDEKVTDGPTVGPTAADAPPLEVQKPEGIAAPEGVDFQPVEGGNPASEKDRAEIEALVRGQDEQVGFRDYLSYIPNRTCKRVKDQSDPSAYDLSNLPNTPIRENPEFAAGDPHTESISDVMVNGDEASATVVAVSNGEPKTQTMRFHREGGKWTFCN
ncbi:Rv0361 family membrane protein [Corynebacterium gerontici]|uniref:Secreted protein n=1 Tax=Corynebacterium gerontici TaxID=2079234 RepID=A0A3G6J1D5_9CORY|nr:hypothetical protein [Corynebacterium gerontici]AZA11736.1 hypothetical protein CGERO_07180 [Corynebacterium gerontici]